MDSHDVAATIALELTSDGYVAAVSRSAADGTVFWRLVPPGGAQDAFVAVQVRPDELVLKSWTGWRVTADPTSGVETGRTFTK